ncbi:MAG: hypothetical protein AABZ53_04035, partial [Planctomycetota bacterium]
MQFTYRSPLTLSNLRNSQDVIAPARASTIRASTNLDDTTLASPDAAWASLRRQGKNEKRGIPRSAQNAEIEPPLSRCSAMIRAHLSRAAIESLFMHGIVAAQETVTRCSSRIAHVCTWATSAAG